MLFNCLFLRFGWRGRLAARGLTWIVWRGYSPMQRSQRMYSCFCIMSLWGTKKGKFESTSMDVRRLYLVVSVSIVVYAESSVNVKPTYHLIIVHSCS